MLRITLFVRRITSVLSIAGLACFSQSKPILERTLDLTAAPPEQRRSLGVPGSWGGGTSNGTFLGPPLYDLPLSITVEKAYLHHEASENKIRLEVVVSNVAGQPFVLPSCQDEQKAHGDRQIDRRTFAFRFEFSSKDLKEPMKITGEVTYGAASVPQCGISIAPHGRVRVLLETPVPNAVLGSSTQPTSLTVAALCDELVLENARFSVKKQSNQVRSNPISVSQSATLGPAIVLPVNYSETGSRVEQTAKYILPESGARL